MLWMKTGMMEPNHRCCNSMKRCLQIGIIERSILHSSVSKSNSTEARWSPHQTASTQGVIACTVGSQPAGTPISVQDSQGNVLISYETQYNCVLVIISTPELQKGESYTLTVGEYAGSVQAA